MEQRRNHSKGSSQSIPQINKWSRAVLLSEFIIFIVFFAKIIQISPAFALEPPFSLPSSNDLLRIKSAIISTSRGKLTFELYPEEAPWHVSNFKYLADTGFYSGKTFHILIDDFIIQAGRNNNPDLHYVLPAEFSPKKHEFGVLGMARAPDYMNPERSSSATQFHILLREASNMDGIYTIFGKLIDGSEVLESLKRNDRINEVTVYMEGMPSEPGSIESPKNKNSQKRYTNYYGLESLELDQWKFSQQDARGASLNSGISYGRLP